MKEMNNSFKMPKREVVFSPPFITKEAVELLYEFYGNQYEVKPKTIGFEFFVGSRCCGKMEMIEKILNDNPIIKVVRAENLRSKK